MVSCSLSAAVVPHESTPRRVPPVPPVTRYVTTRDGRSIAYSVVGDGPVDLLYVPQAINAMEHIWDHPTVAAFFARLAGFSRLILFDRRGSGMSERLEEPAPLE